MGDTVFDNGCTACEASCIGICLECYKASRGMTDETPTPEQPQVEPEEVTLPQG
jgi:hypothetical protein